MLSRRKVADSLRSMVETRRSTRQCAGVTQCLNLEGGSKSDETWEAGISAELRKIDPIDKEVYQQENDSWPSRM